MSTEPTAEISGYSTFFFQQGVEWYITFFDIWTRNKISFMTGHIIDIFKPQDDNFKSIKRLRILNRLSFHHRILNFLSNVDWLQLHKLFYPN